MLTPFKHKNVKKHTFLFLKLKKYNFYETIPLISSILCQNKMKIAYFL